MKRQCLRGYKSNNSSSRRRRRRRRESARSSCYRIDTKIKLNGSDALKIVFLKGKPFNYLDWIHCDIFVLTST
jgi:hypothetical protein